MMTHYAARFFSRLSLTGVLLTAVLSAYVAVAAPVAPAEGRSPLLMDGKTTLFQRVITAPGAQRHTSPGSDGREMVKPFSVLYVYDRKDQGGRNWLEVSPATNGRETFWVSEQNASEWKQALTLLFTDRMGRQPVLFFKDDKGLTDLAESPDLAKASAALITQFQQYAKKNTEVPASFPVQAMEPTDEDGAVSRQRFYIMPIFDWQDPFQGVKFLKVASIDPGSKERPADGKARTNDGKQAGKDGNTSDKNANDSLKTGIVFVIDTTISMKPYIVETLAAARTIYDRVEKSGVADKVGLAVVAFRNSTTARKGLEYTSKVISPFREAKDRASFEAALGDVQEAKVSSHDYNEDSYAGIRTAIDDLDWSPYQSRLIMLITDAGPLRSNDPYASTQMGAEEIADLARAKRIRILAAHVKSPSGSKNHAYAALQYKNLTEVPGEGMTAYYPLDASTPKAGAAAFGSFATSVGNVFVDLARTTANQEPMPKPAEQSPSDKPEDQGRWLAENLGYSMQLDYLGDKRGNRAPEVRTSWIADMDLPRLAESRRTETVEVAVLLTKNQLSTLQKQLKIIVDNAERTKKTGARDFFQSILSASAQMARDPGAFTAHPNQNLQTTGVLGEFLDGLPYRSQVLQMTDDDWNNMNLGQQTQFINRLKSRIARYDEYERDRDNWESFGAPDSDDWVYRVPLSMLP